MRNHFPRKTRLVLTATPPTAASSCIRRPTPHSLNHQTGFGTIPVLFHRLIAARQNHHNLHSTHPIHQPPIEYRFATGEHQPIGNELSSHRLTTIESGYKPICTSGPGYGSVFDIFSSPNATYVKPPRRDSKSTACLPVFHDTMLSWSWQTERLGNRMQVAQRTATLFRAICVNGCSLTASSRKRYLRSQHARDLLNQKRITGMSRGDRPQRRGNPRAADRTASGRKTSVSAP